MPEFVESKVVIYSPTRGVYLGGSEWSFGYTGPAETAPCYPESQAARAIRAIDLPAGEALTTHPVFSKEERNTVTVEECANAGLPRWGRTKEK